LKERYWLDELRWRIPAADPGSQFRRKSDINAAGSRSPDRRKKIGVMITQAGEKMNENTGLGVNLRRLVS
jgi:hypothetical protein